MTGKVLDNGVSKALAFIFPIALIIMVVLAAWPYLLTLLLLALVWKLWQNYQWKQWSKQINPFFHELIKEHQGCLTPMDLSIKANLTARAAKRFLDKQAEEYGAQCQVDEEKGTVYYFMTASAISSIFAESEPSTVSDYLKTEAPSSATIDLERPVENHSPTLVVETEAAPELDREVEAETLATATEDQTPAATSTETTPEEELDLDTSPQSEVTELDTPSTETTLEEELDLDTSPQSEVTELDTPSTETTLEEELDLDTSPQSEVTELDTPSTETTPEEELDLDTSPQSEVTELDTPSTEATPEEELDLDTSPQSEVTELDTPSTETTPEEETPTLPSAESESEESPNYDSSQNSFALIQADLAKRLDLHASTIGKRKSDPDFPQWSQSKDPEGIAWQYSPETKMFEPVELEEESS